MKYGSRKFIITFSQLPFLAILPLVYKHYGISDSITIIVLSAIAGSVAGYSGFNILAKKWGVDDGQDQKQP